MLGCFGYDITLSLCVHHRLARALTPLMHPLPSPPASTPPARLLPAPARHRWAWPHLLSSHQQSADKRGQHCISCPRLPQSCQQQPGGCLHLPANQGAALNRCHRSEASVSPYSTPAGGRRCQHTREPARTHRESLRGPWGNPARTALGDATTSRDPKLLDRCPHLAPASPRPRWCSGVPPSAVVCRCNGGGAVQWWVGSREENQ